MKLESLNNKKFKLNTKEMGSLVGGAAFWVASGAGTDYYGIGKDRRSVSYSADATQYASQSDYNSNFAQQVAYYDGQNDAAVRDAAHPCTQK